MGGLGSGSIGRGWRGEFQRFIFCFVFGKRTESGCDETIRWQLIPSGNIQMEPVDIDLFSVRIERPNQPVVTSVLFPEKLPNPVLESWDWNVTGQKSTYHGLFPRSWYVYEEPDPRLRLTCKQLSPVIAHNYKESSFPVSALEWTIENYGQDEADVSIMFTFQNGYGAESDSLGGHYNTLFVSPPPNITGVTLNHVTRKTIQVGNTKVLFYDPLAFGIGVLKKTKASEDPTKEEDVRVSICTTFLTNDRMSTRKLWQEFKKSGTINPQIRENSEQKESKFGETIGTAISATVKVPPGQNRKIVFSLVWDCPRVRFAGGNAYYRKYCQVYGTKGESAQKMAIDTLENYENWELQINNWQNPILQNILLPDYYRAALFNELYYLVDGGKDKKQKGEFITVCGS